MNQTARLLGKKLKLSSVPGALALSGHKISVDINRQLWYSPSNSHTKLTKVLSFLVREVYSELYIRGDDDFSDRVQKGIRKRERIRCRLKDRNTTIRSA